MALSINGKGTIPLTSVLGTTFTQKLQNAGTSTTYPEGTVFDCSNYKSETITDTITIRRAGITLLFGEGDFTMSAVNRSMFIIEAPNVTIIGVSRSAKDSLSSNGSTRFVMTSTTNTGPAYHVFTKTSSIVGWNSADSLTIMNCDFVGVKSAYTSSGGTVSYSNWGCGGFLLTEGNPDQSGSNLNNLYINEVLINGSTNHGITVYGGMLSKIQNTRVRNAGGHGFYIAGSTTSMSLDTCYASGAHLAGFCLSNSSYSTLNNCASDSNGLGYWMKSSVSITMTSCGAEVCEVRSNIPNNLGIFLQSSAGNVVVNDITSDYAGYIKGTSYMFTGGDNITGVSCYSKDPSNRENETTYLSKYSAHILAAGGVQKVNMDNFKRQGIPPVKYKYRLEDCYKIQIDDTVISFDPLNPSETSNEVAMDMPVADVLDQGSGNIFGDLEDSTSFNGRRAFIGDPNQNYRIENLQALSKFTLPTFDAHPANVQNGTIYFNTTLNKLFIYNDAWYDTCCTSTPEPECTFPSGLASYGPYDYIGNHAAVKVGDYVYSASFIYNANSPIYKSSLSNLSDTVTLSISPDIISYGIPNLTYSAAENALYFSGGGYGSNDEPSYITKFSLISNQVTHYEETNLDGLSNNCNAHVVGNSLYVTRGVYGSASRIQKRSLVDLTLEDTIIGTGVKLIGGFQSNSLVIGDSIIYGRPFGFCDEFVVFDTVAETFTNIPIPGGTSLEQRLNFCKTNNRLYVASQKDGLISEFDFNFNHIATYSNEYIINPSALYVNVVNSKSIVTFISSPSIPGSGEQWSLIAYNMTDDEYIGSSQLIPGTGYNGASFMLELSPTTFAFGAKTLRTICSPYAV